jgi:hypothetical protein
MAFFGVTNHTREGGGLLLFFYCHLGRWSFIIILAVVISAGYCLISVLASMTPIAVDLSDIVQEPNEKSLMTQWRIKRMVSTAGLAKECGVRQCQYFAINPRPVDLPKLSHALNKCWHTFCSD